MRVTSSWQRSSASGGVASRRSSSSVVCSSPFFVSGTIHSASFSSMPDRGSSSAVHSTLNTEWATAMPNMVAGWASSAGANSSRTRLNTLSQTTVPMMLNIRCTTAARRAFLLVPMADSSAVTQVPMF